MRSVFVATVLCLLSVSLASPAVKDSFKPGPTDKNLAAQLGRRCCQDYPRPFCCSYGRGSLAG
ncbi:hypothetical protein FRC08_006344 [Ceratobasidium sp. 394]|nr:hypothetical protein FRC08_006344 [Ceratobasidium sp. 394]